MQAREEGEQFPTQKLTQMRRADPVEEEISSLQSVAHEEVEMWGRKVPGRKESGQFKMMVPGVVDRLNPVHGVVEM